MEEIKKPVIQRLKHLYNQWRSALRYRKDPLFNNGDLDFIVKNLTDWERVFFDQMDSIDQRHAFEVAKTIMNDPRIQTSEERTLLIKVALLHDIGKIKGDFTITQRVLVKIINHFFPKTREKLLNSEDNQTKGTLANAIYVQSVHAKRGSYMLFVTGADDVVVDLVKNHHTIPESRFEKCLWDADLSN